MLSNFQIQRTLMEKKTGTIPTEQQASNNAQQQNKQQASSSINIQRQPKISQQRPIYELDKDIQALLNKADSKFNLGKFAECLQDFEQAEQIAIQMNDTRLVSRFVNVYLFYIARCILGQGKTKFKLGAIKQAQLLLHSSQEMYASAEATALLKEVEKMSYFESLIDFSLQNPLYSHEEFHPSVSIMQDADPLQQVRLCTIFFVTHLECTAIDNGNITSNNSTKQSHGTMDAHVTTKLSTITEQQWHVAVYFFEAFQKEWNCKSVNAKRIAFAQNTVWDTL